MKPDERFATSLLLATTLTGCGFLGSAFQRQSSAPTRALSSIAPAVHHMDESTIDEDDEDMAAMMPILSGVLASVLKANAIGPFALGSSLDRAKPPGSRTQLFALRSQTSGLFVTLRSDGLLAPSASNLTPTSLFRIDRVGGESFALRNAGNGAYATAEAAGALPLRAYGGNLGAWEVFDAVDLGGTTVALRSRANWKYVTAENGTAPLIANRDNIGGWERFELLPVIDLNDVVNAFADYHPNEAKKNTRYENPSLSYFNDRIIWDRRVIGRPEVAVMHIVDDGKCCSYDWLGITDDKIVMLGTFWSTPNGGQTVLNPPVVYSARFVTTDMDGRGFPAMESTYSGVYIDANTKPVMSFNGSGLVTNKIGFSVINTGGSMGTRWVITINTDNVAMPTTIGESHYFDLGPAPGVYAPEFGFIAYSQVNRPNGISPGFEALGDLIPSPDQHKNYFDFFTY